MDSLGSWYSRFLNWYHKIWWLDVLYPFVLSAGLFSGLTYLIYHGEKHRSISGQAESHFLYFSLRAASPRPVKVRNKVVTVSLQEFDLQYLNYYEHRGFRDVTMEEYARLVEALLKKGAKYIVLNWMQSGKDIPDYKPLTDVLKRAPLNSKIVFAVDPKIQGYIPADLRKYGVVLESDPCALDVQVMCIYQSHWEDWVIQEVVRDTWKNKTQDRERSVISRNLPRIFASYILYLNNGYDFQEYSYTEINDIWLSEQYFSDKFVFVGNSLVQKRLGDYVQLGRVGTSLTSRDKDPRIIGTPYHQFWAQIAQLFIDDSLVTVVPEWMSFSLAIIFAIVITLCLAYLGAPAALGLYLTIAILAPLLNAILIRFFYLYLPIFDTIYAGLSTFILVTFSRLSLESFRHWRLNLQSLEDEEIADVKSNFLSLVSHNLNTPVAKMQGMLDILTQLSPGRNLGDAITRAASLLAEIQLSIKIVLVTTAIEDLSLKHEPMNLSAMRREFQASLLPPLRRMGVIVDFKTPPHDDQNSMIPLHFDKRVLSTALGAMVLLCFEHGTCATGEVCIALCISENKRSISDDTEADLILEVSCRGKKQVDSREEHALQSKLSVGRIRSKRDQSLLNEVSASLLKKTVLVYRGKLNYQEHTGAIKVNAELTPSPGV